MSVTVYSFGVHYKWDLPPELGDQLFLAHTLREDLVTLQHEHEGRVKAVWSSYPGVAAAEANLTAAEEASVAAAEAVKVERVRQRTKRVTGPAATALTEARALAKAARQARRDAIAAVKDDATERLRELRAELQGAQKALYGAIVQERGLYWATFNDVLDHHKTAVQRVAAQRKQGRPAALRHHRWDGSGSIAVQLQRGAGKPQRTPKLISDADGSPWRNVLRLPWMDPDEWEAMTRAERRRAGRVTIRMRCGAGHIEVPVQAHRMLPADADITGARLTVRQVGTDHQVTVTVTARIPDPEPVTHGPTVALHLSWHEEAGRVVAASWASTTPLDLTGVEDVVTADPTRTSGTVLLPARLPDRAEHFEQAQSARDVAFDDAREVLIAWLTEHGPVEHPTRADDMIDASAVSRWRNPARLAVLALGWRDRPDMSEIAEPLEAWRAVDKKAWLSVAHGRSRMIGARTDAWRRVAAMIADQAGHVVVDDVAVAELSKAGPRVEDLPNEVVQAIGRRRALTAPAELRSAVVTAATRDGVPITTVPSAGLSARHASCGHLHAESPPIGARSRVCDGCGRSYDLDRNAVAQLLATAPTLYTPSGTARGGD